MLADLKFALRQLRQSPGFTLTAVLTLALGIGANAAIFTLVNSILLRPLPFPQQERLMRIGYNNSVESPFPKGWIRALGEHSQAFSSIAGFGADAESNIDTGAAADRIPGSLATVNLFDTLGIQPALGRFFSADNAISGQDLVVVLSYGYWREHDGGNPAVLGSTIRIDGIDRRVIGVMPPGVHFPYADTQFLLPVAFKGGDPDDAWDDFELRAIGRLKPGVTSAAAQADLRRLHPLLLPLFPWPMPTAWAADTIVVPLLQAEVGSVQPLLLLLLGAVGLILLIACANVAGLMLARASGREREIAVRGALGATPGRLIRQLLSESMVLGALAGIAGLLAAVAGLQALISLLPSNTPRIAEISIHWPVFLFAAAASLLTGLLFGLIPALKMSSPHLTEALHAGSRSVAGRPGQFRVSTSLVMAQIALSVVVISAAGLMLHTLWRLSQVNPGFRTSRIVTAEVSLDADACRTPGHCQTFFTTLLDHTHAIPGVTSTALVDSLPMSGFDENYVYDAENHPRQPSQSALQGSGRIVSPGYFATLGLRLESGRLLTVQDESGISRAAVINQAMAKHLWPQQNPLGKHIIEVAQEKTPAVWSPGQAQVIVGVVSNTHHANLSGGFDDEIYLPLTSADERAQMYVLLRTSLPMEETASALRQTVAALDPQAPVTRVRSMDEVIASSESAPRSLALLLLAFGALAVVIGGVGAYSLIAYTVNWRTREIGIRLALGAQRGQILSDVVRQSLILSLGGCAVGLAGAALAAQMLRSFLYGVSTVDPLTFSAVALLMVLLAIAAAWIPARRAASVDPITTLRQE
jgi:predicted permease